MDQDPAESGREAEVYRGEDTVGEQDDDIGRDREYGSVPFIVQVEPYDGAADPCGWGICASGQGVVGGMRTGWALDDGGGHDRPVGPEGDEVRVTNLKK